MTDLRKEEVAKMRSHFKVEGKYAVCRHCGNKKGNRWETLTRHLRDCERYLPFVYESFNLDFLVAELDINSNLTRSSIYKTKFVVPEANAQ